MPPNVDPTLKCGSRAHDREQPSPGFNMKAEVLPGSGYQGTVPPIGPPSLSESPPKDDIIVFIEAGASSIAEGGDAEFTVTRTA